MTMRMTNSQAYLTGNNDEGCWPKKSGLEQKLIILTALLAVTTLGLVIALAVFKTNESTKTAPTPDVITECDTKECNQIAAFYKKRMNLSANPCQDFYGYVCGQWDKDTNIPDDKGQWGVFDDLRDELAVTCIANLKQTPEPVTAVGKARTLFQGCLKTDGVPKNLSIDQLNDIMATARGNPPKTTPQPTDSTTNAASTDPSTDPSDANSTDSSEANITESFAYSENFLRGLDKIIGPPEQIDPNDKAAPGEPEAPISSLSQVESDNDSWVGMLGRIIKNFGQSYLIDFSMSSDEMKSTSNVIYIDQPSFGIGRLALLNMTDQSNVKLVEAYKTYLRNIYCLVWLREDVNCSQSKDWADKILNFESELAKQSSPPEERRDPVALYKAMFIEDLQKNISNIHWLFFISSTMPKTGMVDLKTRVVVKDLKYVKEASLLADSKPDLANDYLLVRLLMNVGPLISKDFRDIMFEFQKVSNGLKSPVPVEKLCYSMVNSELGHAVARMYIDEKFDQNSKDDMEEMTSNLAEAFRKLLNENDWMDTATKKAANEKLKLMTEMIGYPDWTKIDQKLNDYYQNYELFGVDKYFDNYKSVMAADIARILLKLNKPVNRTLQWESFASIVNAFYSPTANSITFPAGILQSPFYQNKRPMALNYGGIGYVIGHEITHGFDDSGKQYNGMGNLHDWWTDATLSKFNTRKKCLEDQYSKITDKQTQMKLNGAQTIGENIADNGGIREAFQAYKLSQGKKERLAGFDLTDEQLFFVSAASVWCTKFRTETLRDQINYGVHSPGMYRATIPLSNDVDFANVFNCEKDTAMNPDNRCIIW